MYLPSHFSQTDRKVLHQLIQEHPLATLVNLTASGLEANHIPLLLNPDEGAHGVLQGHVARTNPVWREAVPQTDVLAIFQGPQAYISPGWYPTKKETGKVVPTWNYAVVHAPGQMRIMDDAQWLRALLTRLTARHGSVMAQPWSLQDAPDDYIEKMLGAVVGIEISITAITGKLKLSQNQAAHNVTNVIDGLRQCDLPEDKAMADIMANRQKL